MNKIELAAAATALSPLEFARSTSPMMCSNTAAAFARATAWLVEAQRAGTKTYDVGFTTSEQISSHHVGDLSDMSVISLGLVRTVA
jgi:hypothetical protein